MCAHAEHLANEHFTSDMGLVSDHVNAVAPDSRGFVWIGTNEGLSRFDGASFENYTVRDGLPDNNITGIVEDRIGNLWIATEGGLARITASAPHIRLVGARQRVNAIVLGGDGAIWLAADASLLRVDPYGVAPKPRVIATLPMAAEIHSLAAEPRGDVWMGTSFGLWRRTATGQLVHYAMGSDSQPFDDYEQVRYAGVTPDGIVWFSHHGIFAFRPDGGTDRRPLLARVRRTDVVRPEFPFRLPEHAGEVMSYVGGNGSDALSDGPVVSGNGTLWAATPFALMRVTGNKWSELAEESGVAFDELQAIAVDRNGTVWLGTLGDGVLRLPPQGFVSYSTADGLLHKRVTQAFELRDGTLVVASGGNHALQFLDGTRFRGALQKLDLHDWGWGWNQIVCADREGDVWIGTGEGLLRYRHAHTFAQLMGGTPVRYTERDGLGGHNIFRVWEDSRGEIWVGTFGEITLARYDRASGRFIRYPPREGIPHNSPSAFAEDRSGNVLVGWYEGGFSRISRDGSVRFFGVRDGVPPGFVHALLVDSHATLWIASGGGGIGVVEHPDREPFVCRRITREDGLSSNTPRALVEAADGAMWIGSNRGIDRIPPGGSAANARVVGSSTITHYGRDDGLTNVLVTNAFRDRTGVLWFGTVEGVSAMPMTPAPPSQSDKTLITRVIVDGVPIAVPPFGSNAVGGFELGPATRRIEFHFVAPALRQRRSVRYVFRLAGVDDTWSETSDGAVRFEHLPARDLRFEVSALASGVARSPIANVAFRVAPPFWRRWWFMLLSLAALVALLVTLYRARVGHLLALERMRTRIATDLHDDLGSSLSSISILSEVARHQVEGSETAGILDDIGSSARTLIGALADSIWAVDPRADDLESVVERSRDQVHAVLEAAGIEARFDVRDGLRSMHLRPEVRRHLHLILKESLNNVARHSRAHSVVVSIGAQRDRLSIEVADDGRGFDPTRISPHQSGTGGRGLASLHERARRLGGTLTVQSAPDRGTRLHFEIAP